MNNFYDFKVTFFNAMTSEVAEKMYEFYNTYFGAFDECLACAKSDLINIFKDEHFVIKGIEFIG